jgi:3-hydroxybutyryl-CoA dehydratase
MPRLQERSPERGRGREVRMSSKHGYYLEDLKVGMFAEMTRVITEEDINKFADLTGDYNPVHVDEEFAKTTIFGTRIVHGAFVASLLSAVMGMKLPGPGAIFRTLNLNYRGPVRLGETILAHVEIAEIVEPKQLVEIEVWCKVNGMKVVRGTSGAWVARRADKNKG